MMTNILVRNILYSYHNPNIWYEFLYLEKSFCYSEGPEQDKLLGDSLFELTENTWFETKPPRLYTKEFFPLVTARQIYVTRVLLEGKRAIIEDAEDAASKHKEKVNISMNKKKSAVRFLSNVHLE